MGTKVVITIKDPRPIGTVKDRMRGASKRVLCSKMADYFDAMAMGSNRATMDLEFSEEQVGEAPVLEVKMPEPEAEPKKKTRKKVSV